MAKAREDRPSVEAMPQPPAAGLTVEEVALHIFSKLFIDTAGRTPLHLAERAFEVAEVFKEVAHSRGH